MKKMDESAYMPDSKLPPREELGAALQRVLASDAFAGAQRLQSFLAYVVEEALAGRGKAILGKTIAEDVYGRVATGDGDNENVVRVDAGRLRRRLSDYYAGAGRQDRIRIAIPSGTYVPQFIAQAGSINDTTNPKSVVRKQSSEASVPTAVVQPSHKIEMQRRAMFDKSPASLQAFNFAHQARNLIWPPSDPIRLKGALELFERAIRLDPKYFGGYAGASNVCAFLAFLPGSDDADQMLAKAREMASIAQELNPTNGWVQSALAWISFVANDFDRAKELSERAIILDRKDLYLLDFHVAMLVLNGDFEDAIQVVRPFISMANLSPLFAHKNAFIVASFYLGRYRDAIKNFIELSKLGGDMSPLLLSYFAASYQAIGEHKKAQNLVEQIKISWPSYQPDKLLYRIFRYPKHAQAAIELLRAAA